jgi:hypothetical protein
MKSHPLSRLVCLGLAAWGALPAVPAAENPRPAKSHVLFMGADLAVEREKKYYRVADVVGSELKIRIGQKEFFVPTRQRQTGLKVDYGLKLTDAMAQIDGLQSGPAYTPGNDPRLKFDRESGAAGGAAAVQDLAYGQMLSASLSAGFSSAAAANSPRPETEAAAAAAQTRLEDSMRQLDRTSQMRWDSQNNTGRSAEQMELALAEGNYDAMDVSFKVSAPVELDDPYMVVLFRFLERDAKPGQEGMLIHAKALDPIGRRPHYVRVVEGGLPMGFKFVDCQVHIYNHGQEVATNVSPKRVELTHDEARQYILIDYLGSNKGANLPAGVAPGTLPRARRAELSLDQLNRIFYVKVSPDGLMLGAFQDEACHDPLTDAGTLAALGDVFFKPALAQGKPAEGVARVRLGEI